MPIPSSLPEGLTITPDDGRVLITYRFGKRIPATWFAVLLIPTIVFFAVIFSLLLSNHPAGRRGDYALAAVLACCSGLVWVGIVAFGLFILRQSQLFLS